MGLPPLTPLQKVHSIVFSEGTYQVELEALGDFFWLFLQMSEEGAVTDCFCSCEATREQCPHEKVALLAIFNGFLQPLHKRFKESLWNHLCQMASRRHGYLPSCLEKTDRYSATSLVGKLLCSIQPLHPEAVEKLQEMIDLRPKETEENSLKFSNRSQEEMTLWRQGRASEEFCYELSFWSDLAKWCMELQERKEPYKIVF